MPLSKVLRSRDGRSQKAIRAADLKSFVSKGGEEEDGDRCASSGTEESPVQQSQGVVNHGCEGEDGKTKPWWHLPGEKDLPVCDRDKDKEGNQDNCSQKRIDLYISQHNSLSSPHINSSSASSAPKDNVKEDGQEGCSQEKLEVDNTEQCHGPSGGIKPSTALAKLEFSPSDLQHCCYCSNPSCSNAKCSYVKADVEHLKTHKDWVQCQHCKRTRALVSQHAETCCLHGCRIPLCHSIRKSYGAKRNIAKPRPVKAPLVPEALMYSNFPQRVPQFDLNDVNGKVIFRKTNLMPEDYFQEHTHYYVDRKALGEGSFGHVYRVYLQSDRSKKVVVKETTYRIEDEEVEVYKLLGDHKHIVKHLGVTSRGTQRFACIFMELCDDSLYNFMENTRKRRLSVKEAMRYWLQIREAVDHLHNLGIIHKDIKAKNVLMKKGRVLLADFDSAKRLLNGVTEKGLKRRGTKGFVSPEVWARAPHGRPVDIFGMGCFLIEMTIGPPVNNTLKEKIEMLRELDSELAELVEACVSKRPEDRPTARSLLDWPVVKKYVAAGKGEVGREENAYHWSQDQKTSTTEDQTATLRTLENRAGESDLSKICASERSKILEL